MSRRDPLGVALVAFALVHAATALLMAVSPSTFWEEVGPYGTPNDHYIRDLATFYGAFAVGPAVAALRPSWRTPVLVLLLVQYALHTVNHVADVGETEPERLGPVNLALIAAGALGLVAMLRASRRGDRARVS